MGKPRDHLPHAFQARIAKRSPQPIFGMIPVTLGVLHFSLPCRSKTEQTFALVLAALYPNPTLLQQKPQRPGQGRTIHGETGAQALLIGLARRSQRGQQAEVGDFEACLPQFLVINPGDNSRDAPQVLTGAGQVKQC